MRKTESLEKTLMLGKIKGRRRRGQQRMRWLDGVSNSMGKLREMVRDREAGRAAVHGVPKEVDRIKGLNNSNKCFLRTPFKFTHGRMQLLINLISLKTEPHNHRTTTTTQKRHLITSVVLRALGESHQVPPHRGKKLPEGMKTREAGVTELFQKQPTDLPSWTDESLPTVLGNDTCMSSVQLSCSVVPDSLRPHGLQPIRLLCPWDFPGKDTGASWHVLLRLYTLLRSKAHKSPITCK